MHTQSLSAPEYALGHRIHYKSPTRVFLVTLSALDWEWTLPSTTKMPLVSSSLYDLLRVPCLSSSFVLLFFSPVGPTHLLGKPGALVACGNPVRVACALLRRDSSVRRVHGQRTAGDRCRHGVVRVRSDDGAWPGGLATLVDVGEHEIRDYGRGSTV